jgi:hypothetical protein
MNTALEYSTRVVQEGGRRCKKSTLNDLVHLTDPSKNTFNEPAKCLVLTQLQESVPPYLFKNTGHVLCLDPWVLVHCIVITRRSTVNG